ncbi:MAG: ATP-binding protein [Oscillospiraceae bacterium]|nr:ATP-binding protein [Oscillospiraceae bacterium]
MQAAYIAEVAFRGMDYKPNADTAEIFRQTADALTGRKNGLFLCGKVGNGKTTLLHALQNAMNWLTEKGCYDNGRNSGLVIVSAKSITERNWLDTARTECALGIDDLGCEAVEQQSYGNISTPIINLIEHRYENRLYTVITSNLTAADIKGRYGERVGDRMREQYGIVAFRGEKSFRQ